MRARELPDARTQSDPLEHAELKTTQDRQSSLLDRNTHDLPQVYVTLFIVARSIRETHD